MRPMWVCEFQVDVFLVARTDASEFAWTECPSYLIGPCAVVDVTNFIRRSVGWAKDSWNLTFQAKYFIVAIRRKWEENWVVYVFLLVWVSTTHRSFLTQRYDLYVSKIGLPV